MNKIGTTKDLINNSININTNQDFLDKIYINLNPLSTNTRKDKNKKKALLSEDLINSNSTGNKSWTRNVSKRKHGISSLIKVQDFY